MFCTIVIIIIIIIIFFFVRDSMISGYFEVCFPEITEIIPYLFICCKLASSCLQ
jgi:hypothetical protein